MSDTLGPSTPRTLGSCIVSLPPAPAFRTPLSPLWSVHGAGSTVYGARCQWLSALLTLDHLTLSTSYSVLSTWCSDHRQPTTGLSHLLTVLPSDLLPFRPPWTLSSVVSASVVGALGRRLRITVNRPPSTDHRSFSPSYHLTF